MDQVFSVRREISQRQISSCVGIEEDSQRDVVVNGCLLEGTRRREGEREGGRERNVRYVMANCLFPIISASTIEGSNLVTSLAIVPRSILTAYYAVHPVVESFGMRNTQKYAC